MDLDLTKCCNCGKEFSKQKKSYGRRSLGASAKLKKIDKTLKDIIEEEFTVKITPDSKNQRFLCESCSWMLVSMAKSSVAKQEALERLKGATGGRQEITESGTYSKEDKKTKNCFSTKANNFIY
ncbi:hypothetical protein DPMN_112812 [Dreissena polymorpha]|uniref:Uncharacterized protein n=1 Tax=Dreissena polymorpha TaxID=45954 RepID=A0A9D4QQD1_DREPO|nr:hypothetical protein DPMN_112812 [Dreissena polymorpha]